MARIIKHPGLNRHAKALGVTPGHLSKVVSGERVSVELLARYRALVAADPNASRGVTVSYLPPGTVLKDCLPEHLLQAQKLGEAVEVEGSSIILRHGFTLAIPSEGEAIMRPAGVPVENASPSKTEGR